jgi:hypothetical protein
MALEPTSIQRDRMLTHGKTKLTLIQFLVMKDPGAIGEYLTETGRAVIAQGGSRNHQLKIDRLLTGGEMPYHYLTVDSYPSSQALLLAHESTREHRLAAANEVFALIVRPNPAIKKIAVGLGFLSKILSKLLGTAEIREVNHLTSRLDPDTDPDPERVALFKSRDQNQAFYMMNLNQFVPAGKWGGGGKGIYNQYSAQILPFLVSVGGYPDIYGKILSTYIGDQNSSLYNSWHDFALVYYPSRTSFLRLMTNTPQAAAHIRRTALKKVVLMPSSKL